MEMSIEIVEERLFDGAVADEIVASINDAVSDRGRCSLSLAGGSTPGSIYRVLAKPPRVTEVNWNKVALYWGDERWVPHDHVQSNYKMVHETLLLQLANNMPNVCAVNTAAASVEDGATAYAAMLENNEKKDGKGNPVLDVVLLGIGEDGHTASIFPGSEIIQDFKAGKVAAAPVIPAKNPHDGTIRVSFSPETILAARRIIFIVKGEAKAGIMKRVIEGSADEVNLPSQMYRAAQGRVTFFLDTGAAQQLAKH